MLSSISHLIPIVPLDKFPELINVMNVGNGSFPSLLDLCLLSVADSPSIYENCSMHIPPNIKTKLTRKLAKRGLLTDVNLSKLIHKFMKELDLSNSEISDSGLENIAECCKLLQKLDLNSAKQSRKTVSDIGFIAIGTNCKMLQVLYARRCLNVTDKAISHIAERCRWLRFINLGGCTLVSDESLRALAMNCHMIESLNVSSTNVSISFL